MTKSLWWRRTFGDNFSLEHELDAKVDRLKILLLTMPQNVVPQMDPALRKELLRQLDLAGELLAACEPFERVMQRINFVEAEIMMRLADERLDLAVEALRAEANISLPEPAATTMLAEIDKLASSAEDVKMRKVKIVGLKARLTASVIELFRGSERARDAIQILGVALIALTLALVVLFSRDAALSQALFTHYGATVSLQRQAEPGQAVPPSPTVTATIEQPASTAAAQPPAPETGAAAQPQVMPDRTVIASNGETIQIIPNGKSPLIDLAFQVLIMAACFGGIGACLSGLFSFTLQGRVPNEYEGWFRTLIRPMIGIASGFLAVFILRSGLLTFGDDVAWVAIVALSFGFSERLFMGTMARLEGLPK
ncbi:MAG TPA: hypothetical protein VFG43_16705 [Geminicoccaceae bacterium]|nr:hypothetical protein [Geminicoccaceae bacterium]